MSLNNLHVRDDEEPDVMPYKRYAEVLTTPLCHQCGEPGHVGSRCRLQTKYSDESQILSLLVLGAIDLYERYENDS